MKHDALGVGDPNLTHDERTELMLTHPVLINSPVVVTPLGVMPARPSETVLDSLPSPQRRASTRADGEPVVDAARRRTHPAGER